MIRFIFVLLIAFTALIMKPFFVASLFSLATFMTLHFAIVGVGNRLMWSFILPILLLVFGVCAYFSMQLISIWSPLLQALLGFLLITILPALSFYLAHRFQQFRATRSFLPRE